MATNLKGQSGIKGLLLLHGEKIAIVLVGVAALWFVYSSYKLPRLDEKFQAAKLQSEISQTNAAIKDFSWDKAVADHPDKVYKAKPIAAKAGPIVKAPDYTDGNPAFDTAIVAPLILRTDPVILNPIEVQAFGGSGLLAFLDENIRKQQELRLAQEQQEAEAKALEQQKKAEKEQKKQAEGPGGRRGRGPDGAFAEEKINDPNHPKRRRLEGMVRPAGTQLQGGERIERAYWACVVAKVPIREQLKLYQDSFEKARGYDATRDFPSYVGFLVERAEVIPGKEKELQWKATPLYDGQRQSIAQNKPLTSEPLHAIAKSALDKLANAAQMFWAGGIAPDVIDDRLAEYPLTLPLPPLVGRDWGAEVTHPDIPPPPLEEEIQPVQQTPEQQPGATDSPFGSANPDLAAPGANVGGPGSAAGREFPGAPGGGFGARRFGGPEMGPGMGPGMGGPGMAYRGGRGFSAEGGPGGAPGGSFRGTGTFGTRHTFLPKGVDYYLLRFFDFNVEPGKKYKYRIKLVMNDPNYNMPANVLAPAVLDRQGKEFQAAKAKAPNAQKPFFRVVENWSDPSPAVGIPMAGSVRLADAKIPAAEKFNDEPSVKLLVEAFDVDATGNAIQAGVEKDVRRGYVANTVEDAEYLAEGGIYIDTQPGFKFLTGMTLLDISGGTKLTRELTVPARVMVMGPAGQLYIRNEIDDKPFAEYHKMLFEKTNQPRGPGGLEGEPGGPGGRMRQRGGRT